MPESKEEMESNMMDNIQTKTKPDIFFEEDDLAYEEDILRHPFSVKCWLRYIEHKKSAPKNQINMIYERSLKELPGSYKLWYNYLKLRRKQIKGRCIIDPCYEDVNNAFERALVFMHEMPRIWLDYLEFLMVQCKVTRSRWTFDRALRTLPVTQHHRVWPLYLEFVKKHKLSDTGCLVYRRYLKLCPEDTEDYIEFLLGIGRLDEAAVKLAELVNKKKFVSKQGKSNHQLWHELCELLCKNPDKIKSLKVDAIIRGGLRRFTDEIGKLWNSLADYYIRSGHFEKARDIYEEAIQSVTTARDFTQVFDAYAQFLEKLVNAKMEAMAADANPSEEDDLHIELYMSRLEDVMERRPLLLNSVMLRQNPHNVHEWHKRVQLYADMSQPLQVINTYTEAVQTVDVKQAQGKPHTLWVEFAKFYEKNKQLADAREVFDKATQVNYKKVDDLAAVWCQFCELELRHDEHQRALSLLRRATALPSKKAAYFDESETVQARVYKSLKLWSLYADLEESFGTFKSCKSVYDRIIDLKIATPQIIINYGMFLEENNYYEEAFKAYEKGVSLFRWPNVYDIWNTYLIKFIKRYGGKKLERARDLFEQCLESCPPKFAKNMYLLYAKLEEDFGLSRHAMAVYDRATTSVLPEEQNEMFRIYISRATKIFGVTKTREIYQKAIDVLTDQHARDMCLKFADLETKLGEIDRARAIYSHCSQFCDPRSTAEFWQAWKEFEVKHGNEDTVREMLRIKRSVQATYNTQVNFMAAQMLAAAKVQAAESGEVAVAPGEDTMKALERAATDQQEGGGGEAAKPSQPAAAAGAAAAAEQKQVLFVRGESSSTVNTEIQSVTVKNPDEIDIDDDEDEDEDIAEGDDDDADGKKQKKKDVKVEKQIVPDEVFGGLLKHDDDNS